MCLLMQIEKQQTGNLVTGQESINAPAGCVFIRAIQVYDTHGSAVTGANVFRKKDMYLSSRIY